MRNAVTKATSVEDVTRLQLAHLRRIAAPVLESGKPLALVAGALREGGYGGDLHPALLTYLAATSRVLAMRQGTMPAHLLLVGPPSSGKSYTIGMVLRLLPRSAYHVVDAGSPRVLIYETADLSIVSSSSERLTVCPLARTIRPRRRCGICCRTIGSTTRSPFSTGNTGKYRVHHIKKKGPTALITTSTRIYHLLNKAYSASLSGVGEGVREVVRAVAVLKERVRIRGVTGTLVAQELGVHKMAASRRIRSALRRGWLVNSETRRGYPQDLRIGEPLPEDAGLPRPEVFGGVTP